jgi:Protein of unknown function (DUF1569)
MENNRFINFADRKEILKSLSLLNADTKPKFGILTPQLMAEHLAINIQFSNGKNPLKRGRDVLNPMKGFLYSNNPLSEGGTFFLTGRNLPSPISNNLYQAIEHLHNEINDFEKYFEENPTSKPNHAVFGNLNKEEWIIYHNKHFTHHFKQFGIY